MPHEVNHLESTVAKRGRRSKKEAAKSLSHSPSGNAATAPTRRPKQLNFFVI
jgi:hypothetical protein